MREQSPEIKILFRKYLDGRCSSEDLKALLQYFKLEDSRMLEELIAKQFEGPVPEGLDQGKVDALIHHTRAMLMEKIQPQTTRLSKRMWYSMGAAAAVLFFLMGIGWYVYTVRSKSQAASELVSRFGADVAPQSGSAYITFSNGQQVALDATQSGLITKDGTYRYMGGDEVAESDAAYATVSTPNGGTFQVKLPDGSKAWLNTQSSIKYPSHFLGNERTVEITGEVYLDVYPDKEKPFVVRLDNQRIEVLGTAFNVRAYDNTCITTLIHGKVALRNMTDGKPYVLNPGDQAKLSNNSVVINKVNTADYVLWKEGIILLRDATLKETCTELERWYDVKFLFPKGFNNTGKGLNSINRTEMLSSVLTALKNTYEVDFEIKGKEVFVK